MFPWSRAYFPADTTTAQVLRTEFSRFFWGFDVSFRLFHKQNIEVGVQQVTLSTKGRCMSFRCADAIPAHFGEQADVIESEI